MKTGAAMGLKPILTSAGAVSGKFLSWISIYGVCLDTFHYFFAQLEMLMDGILSSGHQTKMTKALR